MYKSVPTYLVHVEIFHWISEKFGLLVALDQGIIKVIRVHPLGTICGYLYQSSWILFKVVEKFH